MEYIDEHDPAADGSMTLMLLTTVDCHLCEHARRVLDKLAEDSGLAWHELTAESPEGRRLAEAAPPLRPVLFGPDGRVIAYGRLSEKRLRRDLESLARAGTKQGAHRG